MDNDAGGWEPSQLRDFRAQIESAPALAAKVLGESGTAQRSLRAVKAGEFLRMDIKPREMLLRPILAAQGLAMIHAKRGVGKTHLAC